jgi:hypothetical protein
MTPESRPTDFHTIGPGPPIPLGRAISYTANSCPGRAELLVSLRRGKDAVGGQASGPTSFFRYDSFVVANAQIPAQLKGGQRDQSCSPHSRQERNRNRLNISQIPSDSRTVDYLSGDEADAHESWARKSITVVAYQFSKLKYFAERARLS